MRKKKRKYHKKYDAQNIKFNNDSVSKYNISL